MVNINQCECGSYNIQVTDSRQHGDEIWRTRKCADCGRRVYTTEVCRDDIKNIKKYIKVVQLIGDLLLEDKE